MTISLSDSEFEVAREAVLLFLRENESIANRQFRGLTHLSSDQGISFFNRMVRDGALLRVGKASGTKYVLPS